MDFLTKVERSIRMAAIRGRNNKTTEIALAVLLRQHRIVGWRRHLSLPGRPDFAFRKQKVAIFIDGCFWHGCPDHFRMPSTNRSFWHQKVDTNRARDARVTRELRKKGWYVLRFWEHEIKNPKRMLRRIEKALATHRIEGTPAHIRY
jgi:DNA mismatch endonuclease (patch repair protein)